MIEVLEFRAVERGSLKGFAKIRVPNWKMSIDDVGIHESHGKWWAALPARPMLDHDKKVVIGDDGKVKYIKSLWFDDRETADRFSAAVVEAVMKVKKPAAVNDELQDFRV
jgi:hypothetical protein